MKKVLYTSIAAIALLFSSTIATAQQNVGIGTTPDISARLDISATNKGLLIPRVNLLSLTDGTTIATPAISLLVYNTNTTVGTGYYYNSGGPAAPVWTKLATGSGSSTGWALTGNAGTNIATNFIGTTDNKPLRFRVNNRFSGHLGADNIYFGDSSGVFSDPTSFSNVGIGFNSLYSNTVGSENVALGDFTLQFTDDYVQDGDAWGIDNTAIGQYALGDNEVGAYNTAVGAYSGTYFDENDEDAISYQGFANTAIGVGAACYNAGDVTDVFNSTALGANAVADADNTVRIGDDDVEVIGGITDWTSLSDGRFKKDIKNDGGGLGFIMQLRPVNYHLDYSKLSNNTIDQLKLKIAAYKKSRQKADAKNIAKDPKVIAAYSKAIAKSERMLKILSADKYKNKVSKNRSTVFTGLIAQEVEAAANKAGYDFSGVVKPSSPTGRYGLRYGTFVVPLIEAVQQQQQTIETQNKKIDDLTKRLEKLEALSK